MEIQYTVWPKWEWYQGKGLMMDTYTWNIYQIQKIIGLKHGPNDGRTFICMNLDECVAKLLAKYMEEHGHPPNDRIRKRLKAQAMALYLEEINATNAMIRKSAERMAVNTPIQGTEADMIKAAMIKVKELIDEGYRDKVTLLLQVHDELVFEVDPTIIKEITPKIKKIMEGVIKLSVPIIVDGKHGKNWIDMKPV